MDPKDVKKIKNRIAAARLRERSQQQIRELEAMVQYYKSRAEYLEGIAASCAHCSCLTQMPPSHQGEQSFASPHHHQSQCNSPASSTEDEYMGDASLTLDDIDCDLLEKLLLMAE